MSQQASIPDETLASARPLREAAGSAAALGRVRRRFRVITRIGDLTMSLAEAVHERALAEEAAAMAALAARESVGAEPEGDPPARSETVSSPDPDSQSAQSADRTRAAPRTPARRRSHAAERTTVVSAGELFARLAEVVRQCLELEILIDADLRRLEVVPFVACEQDPNSRDAVEDARQDAARNRVGAMVEGVIDDEANTRQEARELYAALREHLDSDEAYRDLASRPDVVSAASLCRDLGLNPRAPPWPPPDPDGPPRRPKSSPFSRVSRKPIIEQYRRPPPT